MSDNAFTDEVETRRQIFDAERKEARKKAIRSAMDLLGDLDPLNGDLNRTSLLDQLEGVFASGASLTLKVNAFDGASLWPRRSTQPPVSNEDVLNAIRTLGIELKKEGQKLRLFESADVRQRVESSP